MTHVASWQRRGSNGPQQIRSNGVRAADASLYRGHGAKRLRGCACAKRQAILGTASHRGTSGMNWHPLPTRISPFPYGSTLQFSHSYYQWRSEPGPEAPCHQQHVTTMIHGYGMGSSRICGKVGRFEGRRLTDRAWPPSKWTRTDTFRPAPCTCAAGHVRSTWWTLAFAATPSCMRVRMRRFGGDADESLTAESSRS